MTSFGVFEDVKSGIHSKLERMRYKIQGKIGSKNSGKSNNNDRLFDSSNDNNYYCKITDNDNQSDNTQQNNNRHRQQESSKMMEGEFVQKMTLSHSNSSDIGMLPIGKESSCLQDVLEQHGMARARSDQRRNSSHTTTKDLFDVDAQIHKTAPMTVPHLSVRSHSIQQQASSLGPPLSHPQLAQRSSSMSAASMKDMLEVFPQQQQHQQQQHKEENFASFDNFNTDSTAQPVLEPTVISSFGSKNDSTTTSNDPFASIGLFFLLFPKIILLECHCFSVDFKRTEAKPKVTLGALSGNFQQPTPVINVPPSISTTSFGSQPGLTLNKSAPQLHILGQQQQQPQQPPQVLKTSFTPDRSPVTQSQKPKEPQFNLFEEDVFGHMGFSRSHSQGQKTMRDLKKDLLAKDLSDDPEVLKVRQWVDGKEGNLRALLSTLDQVLWDDESRAKWEPVPIHQLVKVSEVRKAYKKAAVVCHPDKVSNFEILSQVFAVNFFYFVLVGWNPV